MTEENQHWVPRFLIAKFADNDGRVFYLDINTDTVGKRTPRQLASDYGFNNFNLNGKIVSYEDALERVETRAAPAFAKIIKQMSTAGLSKNELSAIAVFVSIQALRTRSFHVGLEGDGSRQNFGSTFSILWKSALLEARHIKERSPIALLAPEGHEFILSDHPVTLQHTENPSSREPLGMDVPGVEIYMPLTPRISLYWPCRKIADEFVTAYSNGEEAHRIIRRFTISGFSLPGLDRVSLQDLQRSMLRIAPMRNAIVLGSGVHAPQEIIENANYLQCVWAHSALFARTKDFTFPRRVLSENPQYRTVPRVELLQKGFILEEAPKETDKDT